MNRFNEHQNIISQLIANLQEQLVVSGEWEKDLDNKGLQERMRELNKEADKLRKLDKEYTERIFNGL